MELNPVPVLMATVIYSNIGGSITPVGDPPNVIIASNQNVINSVSIKIPECRTFLSRCTVHLTMFSATSQKPTLLKSTSVS
jgi:hypothetical protein